MAQSRSRSRSRMNTGPQPSLALPVIAGAVVVAAAVCWLRYPGLPLLWLGMGVAAWIEPPAILTGKKDSSGYPTPANDAEASKLARYRLWRGLKWRLLWPGRDVLPGWPMLASWLFSVAAGVTAAYLPVRSVPMFTVPAFDMKLVNAVAVFIVVNAFAAARRQQAGADCPGTRLDSLPEIAGSRSVLAAVVAAGVVGSIAAWVGYGFIPAGLNVGVVVLCPIVFLCFWLAAIGPWRQAALAQWRATSNSRAEWALRWESLKVTPPPRLLDHRMIGQVRIHTFESPGAMGSGAFLPMGAKIAPLVGEGMKVAVLDEPNVGPQGPVPGTRHPVNFRVVVLPQHEVPSFTDPALDLEVAEIIAHCAFVWTVEPLGYGRPVALQVERIDAQPNLEPEPQPDPDGTGGAVSPDDPASVDVAEPAVAWRSRWAWPGGPGLEPIYKGVGNASLAATFGCDVLIDAKDDLVYFGDLQGKPDGYADPAFRERFDELRLEDEWNKVWATVIKSNVNPPVLHHKTIEDRALSNGQIIHRKGFYVRKGEDPLTYQRTESKIATAMNGMAFVAVTGWPGPKAERRGERHALVFALYYSKDAVPQSPEMLDDAPAAEWVLRGRINQAFDACRIARPEVVAARCLTSPRPPARDPRRGARRAPLDSGNIWEIHLRLYDGVTLSHVRSGAERIRQALGTRWLRVADTEDGCILYAGAEPGRANLSDPERDAQRLRSLDWEQAFLDAKIIGAGGQLPRLDKTSQLPGNPDVSELEFQLPSGLDISTLRESKIVKRLGNSTGNEFVDIRRTRGNPRSVTILASVADPMPERVGYDFDFRSDITGVPLATGIEGSPICVNFLTSPHLLLAGVTNGGKSSWAQALIYGLLTAQCDVVVIDPTKGGGDFNFARDYLMFVAGMDPESTDLQNLRVACAALKAVYETGRARIKVYVAAGYGNYRDLPTPTRPLVVFFDEFAGILDIAKGIPSRPYDDPDLEAGRLMALEMNQLKVTMAHTVSKIAAELRSAGVHLVLATQKLSMKMLDPVPNGTNLKNNLARLLLGKASVWDRGSALRLPEEAPTHGEYIPPGRGIWEPLDTAAMAAQGWFATQDEYEANLRQRMPAGHAVVRLDVKAYMPKRVADPAALTLPSAADVAAMFDDDDPDADGFPLNEPEGDVTVGSFEFSLDDLESELAPEPDAMPPLEPDVSADNKDHDPSDDGGEGIDGDADDDSGPTAADDFASAWSGGWDDASWGPSAWPTDPETSVTDGEAVPAPAARLRNEDVALVGVVETEPAVEFRTPDDDFGPVRMKVRRPTTAGDPFAEPIRPPRPRPVDDDPFA